MHITNERLSIVYVSLAMVTVGMLIAETGASLDLLVHQLNLTEAQQGSIISARFLGGVAFGVFLWVRAATVPLGRWFQGSLLLTVATVPLLFVQTFPSAYVAALLRGLTAGFVIPAAGMYATSQRRWPVGMTSGIVNAALSGGLVLVSVAAFSISRGAWARWEVYWGMAPAVAVVTLLVGYLGGASISASVPSAAPGRGNGGGSPGTEVAGSEFSGAGVSAPPSRSHRTIGPSIPGAPPSLLAGLRRLAAETATPFAAAAFFIVGTEAILFGLMPRLSALLAVERTLPSAVGWVWSTEQYALAVMVGVFVGRVGGSFVLRVVRPGHVLIASAASLLAFGVLWLFSSPPWLALSALGFGLSTANFFPALVGAVAEALDRRSPTTIAAMGWTGAAGGTLVPPVAAMLLAAGLPFALMGVVAPLPSVVAVVLSVRAVSRYRRVEEAAGGSDDLPGSE
jgi:hypothetical protein